MSKLQPESMFPVSVGSRLVGQVIDSIVEAMNLRSAALAWLAAFSAADLDRLQEEIHARG